ncbi:Fic family protein [bacterium]|nr:Fic family protein [bacterium]
MKRGLTGKYITHKMYGETYRSFIPFALPPKPQLEIDTDLREKMDQALLSLGRLDSVSTLLPDAHIFLYNYVRKEAVLSSQIEGTQTSLSQLLLFEMEEAPGVPVDDVLEVSNYAAAMNHGLKRIKGGFPLSNRLLREIHGVLIEKKGRGSEKEAGEFRRSQNWIQGTRPGDALFVPPPADQVQQLMSDLEKFIHDKPEKTPGLIKAALAHVQFETIHPFLDGNGRVGRLLITLVLCNEEILTEPLLYLSLYLKQNRKRYYDLLMKVRTEGVWEEWLEFFVDGIKEMADGAVDTARKLSKIAEDDRRKIQQIGKGASSALRVHASLHSKPLGSIPYLMKETGLTAPTVTGALHALQKLKIVKEVTGHKRNRIYAYIKYLQMLSKGTEEKIDA